MGDSLSKFPKLQTSKDQLEITPLSQIDSEVKARSMAETHFDQSSDLQLQTRHCYHRVVHKLTSNSRPEGSNLSDAPS
ncbi:MAG: hypothetical protein CBC13_04240 [Planctomycetia bacterium TMED53]|nr:MAG: hypothetical protein CBC13_04240 [Planctomycetia bacterium TMED53]